MSIVASECSIISAVISPQLILVQLFEVIAKEVPLTFSELNESRLCELLVYILNRVTVGHDSLKFDTVIKGRKCSIVLSLIIY